MIEQTNDIPIQDIECRSLCVFYFLDHYNIFEDLIKKVFENQIKSSSDDVHKQLYFYCGGLLKTFIDYKNESINIVNNKFNINECFTSFTIKQMLQISEDFANKKRITNDKFSFNIKSRIKAEYYDFYSCADKLIQMRNLLAHTLNKIKFKDDIIIQLLPADEINKESLSFLKKYNLDNETTDAIIMQILSNFLYMNDIIKLLEER